MKETLQEQQEHLWSVDPLTNKSLAQPVVSDCFGRLFNKDSVIEFLLPANDEDQVKRKEQEDLLRGAVKSLKDVVEVKFEKEPSDDSSLSKKTGNTRSERWVCPITTKELGSATKAVYLVPCGHAFSEIAIKEVSGVKCLQVRLVFSVAESLAYGSQCNEAYAPNDIIPILSTTELDIARLAVRMKTLTEKGLSHSLKKASGSSKKRKIEASKSEIMSKLEDGAKVKMRTSGPKSGTATPTSTSGIKNAATASLTAKVLEEQAEQNKRRKKDKNDNLSSLFSAKPKDVTNGKGKNNDFMSRGFAIPTHQQK